MRQKVKFTSGRLDAEKRNRLTPISIKQFAGRIAADDSRHTVGFFRYDMAGRSPESYCHYVHIDRLSRIYPAAEFTVDKTDINELAVQVGENGLEATHHDVKMYVHAKRHVRYNPVREYLYCHCYGKWDGKDHIGALARTVPNSNPNWERWFRIWFLGMVYQ